MLKSAKGHFRQILQHDAMARYTRKPLFCAIATQEKGNFLPVPAVSNSRDATAKVTHGWEYQFFFSEQGLVIVPMRDTSFLCERRAALLCTLCPLTGTAKQWGIRVKRINMSNFSTLSCCQGLAAKRRCINMLQWCCCQFIPPAVNLTTGPPQGSNTRDDYISI